jgi:hypothetical protein
VLVTVVALFVFAAIGYICSELFLDQLPINEASQQYEKLREWLALAGAGSCGILFYFLARRFGDRIEGDGSDQSQGDPILDEDKFDEDKFLRIKMW